MRFSSIIISIQHNHQIKNRCKFSLLPINSHVFLHKWSLIKKFSGANKDPLRGVCHFFVSPYWFLFGWWESILLWVVTDLWASRRVSATLLGIGIFRVHPRLDLVNMVVRPFLFTKLSLFTKSSLDKDWNMKKGAGVYSLNRVFH